MLSWALKKSFQGATGLQDASEGVEDTTQYDGPDTPAPVFAARAIKNAIWGQPTTTNDPPPAQPKPNEARRVEPKTIAANNTTTAIPLDTRSPTKLNSILLTPGTGASRRKRVSFGRDVKTDNNVDASPLAASSTRAARQRKKSNLQLALENSRPSKSKTPVPPPVEKPREVVTEEYVDEEEDDGEEGEWEDDVCCHHDVTVDLNEPHSESGKYWKAEWTRYREEAKADIEQLVKFKANARSFAVMKDSEASQLSQKLKEEQAKVAEMEQKIADMTTKLAVVKKHGTDEDNDTLTQDLVRETTTMAEYRERVKDLEARLKEATRQSYAARSSHQRITTTPATERKLIELSRELGRARSELKEVDRLRDEVKRLKSNLATSRERVAALEAQASAMGEGPRSSRVERLEKRLREAKQESRDKDLEIKKLEKDYESLKRDAKSRTAEAIQVLQEKNVKIDELEEKVRNLQAANASKQHEGLDTAMAEHNRITRDLKSGIESLSRPSKYEKARPTNRHVRAASVEDMTLDMTQRSLLRDEDDHAREAIRRDTSYAGGVLTEWTADIPNLDLGGKEENRWRREVENPIEKSTEKPTEEPILEDNDALPPLRAARNVEQRPLPSGDRAVSDVLSNRTNGLSGRAWQRYRQPNDNDTLTTDHGRRHVDRRTASARTRSVAEFRATMRSGSDGSARAPVSRTTRAFSSNGDTQGIDLVENQFSRLGSGATTDRSASGNTSRCALPADRQAAARLRLEQRRERRKESGQALDKENMRPRSLQVA